MKYENTFKAIDQILWKEQGCGSELDYLEQNCCDYGNRFRFSYAEKMLFDLVISKLLPIFAHGLYNPPIASGDNNIETRR